MSIVPIVGLRNALTAAVGKSIGAGYKKAATKQTRTCMRIAVGYMGLMGIFFLVFREQLIRLWSTDSKVIEIGVQVLICAAVYQVFHAAQTIYSGALRGAGDTLWLAGASFTGSIVVLGIGGLIVATFLPQLGALGPWMAATASIVTVGTANRIRFKSNRWKNIDLFKHKIIAVPVEA
jgi:MATE family multidrug resistance protein